MKLYLAFYKGKGSFFSKAIRWWTRSPYSHVEIAVPKNDTNLYECFTSSERDGGVRHKRMELPTEKWDLVEVHIPVGKKGEVFVWFRNNMDKKYDWAGIFGMVVSSHADKVNRYFCSEACLTALQAAGWGLGLRPSKTSPGALYDFAAAQCAVEKK